MDVKTYSKAQLAQMYNVSPETFARWVRRVAKAHDKLSESMTIHKWPSIQLVPPVVVKYIFEALGEPDNPPDHKID